MYDDLSCSCLPKVNEILAKNNSFNPFTNDLNALMSTVVYLCLSLHVLLQPPSKKQVSACMYASTAVMGYI
jgi:hypothetical protein